MLSVIDLFCGAGGFSEGFRQAGFNIVFGIDNNRVACETFQYNFPDAKVVCEDIIKFDDFPKSDIIIGGPPCTEFSKGNVSRTWDTSLIRRFLSIVKKIKPRFFVMENVPDCQISITKEFSKDFPTQLILSASDFECATVRTRLFAGNFPNVIQKSTKTVVVKDVIKCDMSGYRQPFKQPVYRKIDPKKPLFTICSQRIGNERYLLPNGRSLEVAELATIQGFPSHFIFPCSRSEAQRMIGNSVCPPVAKAIAKAILFSISSG